MAAITALIIIPYILVLGSLLVRRLRGWPKAESKFNLRRWGIPVTVVGLAWTIFVLIDAAWPREVTNPNLGSLPVIEDLGLGIIVVGIDLVVRQRPGQVTPDREPADADQPGPIQCRSRLKPPPMNFDAALEPHRRPGRQGLRPRRQGAGGARLPARGVPAPLPAAGGAHGRPGPGGADPHPGGGGPLPVAATTPSSGRSAAGCRRSSWPPGTRATRCCSASVFDGGCAAGTAWTRTVGYTRHGGAARDWSPRTCATSGWPAHAIGVEYGPGSVMNVPQFIAAGLLPAGRADPPPGREPAGARAADGEEPGRDRPGAARGRPPPRPATRRRSTRPSRG